MGLHDEFLGDLPSRRPTPNHHGAPVDHFITEQIDINAAKQVADESPLKAPPCTFTNLAMSFLGDHIQLSIKKGRIFTLVKTRPGHPNFQSAVSYTTGSEMLPLRLHDIVIDFIFRVVRLLKCQLHRRLGQAVDVSLRVYLIPAHIQRRYIRKRY